LRGQDGLGGLGTPQALAFSPDGGELVVGITHFGPPGSLRVYRTTDLGRIAELLPDHPQGGVAQLAFSPDGKTLATAGSDGKVTLWDWPARRPRHQFEFKAPLLYLGIPMQIPLLLISDGTGLRMISTTSGKSLDKFTPDDLQELSRAVGDQAAVQRFAGDMLGKLKILTTAKAPFNGTDTGTRLYLDTGHAISAGLGKKDGRDAYYVGLWSATPRGLGSRVYEGHSYLATSEALSPDRTLVASGDFFGEVHVWEAKTGRRKFRFTGAGQPVYRVGFDASGTKLGLGVKAHIGPRWKINDYADADRSFDLHNRRLLDDVPAPLRTEVTRRGDRELRAVIVGNVRGYEYTKAGKVASRFPAEGLPECLTLLDAARPGFDEPAVFGNIFGSLECKDARTMLSRRAFLGHQGAVKALSESPDGRFLASASTDRTVRIWSLEHFQDRGEADVDLDAEGAVRYLVPGGLAARAGVRLGDKVLAVDGHDQVEMIDLIIKNRWPYRAGQRVSVDLTRDGKPFRVEVELVPGTDFVEPLLSLFWAADGEWVLWTPQGYYDASLGGDRLIGWHVNQGPEKAANFFLAQQFRKQFYRPDVIDQILSTGDVDRAIAAANSDRSKSGVASAAEPLDLRRPEDLRKIEPPTVRILAPAEGTVTRAGRVTVRARIESKNGLPIREVTVLVNGRPSQAKDAGPEPVEAATRERTIEREVELLPGQANRITVVASNSASSSRPVTVSVKDEVAAGGAPQARPKLYLLAIGISDYADPELTLQYPHRDAQDFAAAWKRQEGAVYEKVEARVLVNKEATARAILDGMEWLVNNSTGKDVTILFVSAHGFTDARRNYYMATYDVDPDALRGTAVRWNEVKSLIQDVPGKFILFVDTCHSGGVTGAKGAAGADDPLRELVSEDSGTVVFSSSMAREVSLEDAKWGHGAFTRALLDTMEGDAGADNNHDGYLSLSELNNNLAERVKKLTKGKQHTATEWPPTITDFNFFRFGAATP